MTKKRNQHKHEHMDRYENEMDDVVDLSIGMVKVGAVTTLGMGMLGGMSEMFKK